MLNGGLVACASQCDVLPGSVPRSQKRVDTDPFDKFEAVNTFRYGGKYARSSNGVDSANVSIHNESDAFKQANLAVQDCKKNMIFIQKANALPSEGLHHSTFHASRA